MIKVRRLVHQYFVCSSHRYRSVACLLLLLLLSYLFFCFHSAFCSGHGASRSRRALTRSISSNIHSGRVAVKYKIPVLLFANGSDCLQCTSSAKAT